MDFNEFCKAAMDYMKEYDNEGARFEFRTINKNNGVVMTGLTRIIEGKSCAPSLFMEPFYENYKENGDFNKVMGLLQQAYENTIEIDISGEELMSSFETASKRLALKLVNYERNKAALMDMPHRRIGDLALIYMLRIDDKLSKGVVVLHHEHVKHWNVSEEELYSKAMENMTIICRPGVYALDDILNRLPFDEPELWEIDSREAYKCGFCVLTNNEKLFGASTMLYPGVLDKVSEMLSYNFYIVPSSLHELIIIPDMFGEYNEAVVANLNTMVDEVNRSSLRDIDVLSDSVYYYDRNEGRLIFPSDKIEIAV
ncbi:DUF5688 family protein [Butyrivibrio sp. MC2013]|uniref:DUF5688 family protein n=1 Tax=Butyrivibrio sp. MC2013 TaxID=1280686 RepID=UPI0004007A3F|nr:DUF5688 family protein [Butyrivibrio sp. MC2013]